MDDVFTFIFCGVIALLLLIGGCAGGISWTREDAAREGHAEYFINSTNFKKEFRWLSHTNSDAK